MNELRESLLRDYRRIQGWYRRSGWTWEEVWVVGVAVCAVLFACLLISQAMKP
jgi:hypothetical protein